MQQLAHTDSNDPLQLLWARKRCEKVGAESIRPWGCPVPRGLSHQPWAAEAGGDRGAGKRDAGFQKTQVVFSPAATSGHSQGAKAGEAPHRSGAELLKGGKLSPGSSLTNAARHRRRPAGKGSPAAPQAVPGCQGSAQPRRWLMGKGYTAAPGHAGTPRG